MLQKDPNTTTRDELDQALPFAVVHFEVGHREPTDRAQLAPWHRAFEITPRVPESQGAILLAQATDQQFLLGSTIRFRDQFPTGLEAKFPTKPEDERSEGTIAMIREVTPVTLAETDLASVPRLFRWLLSSYGAHTPAVLIHDRLIGWNEPPQDWRDAYADRYLRFMLKASGVSLLTRWLMWTAVAFRTRWSAPRDRPAQRTGLVLWGFLALVGIAAAAVAVVGLRSGWPAWPDSFGWSIVLGSWGLPAVLALGLPVPASALWGRQAAAGLISVVCAPWVFPPAIIGAVGYGCYRVLDRLTSLGARVLRARGGVTTSPSA